MKFDFTDYSDHKTFKVLYPLAHVIRAFTYDSKAFGKENIPEDNGFLVVCNHVNFLDPGQIALAFDGRPIHYMTKSDPWDKNIGCHLLTKLNAFPVVRGKADMTSLDYATELLKRGKNVCVFPEGTRSKTGEPGRPKKGAALIARHSHANILPMSIYYEGQLKKGLVNSTKMTVRIGKLIPFEELGLTDDGDVQELRAATEKIWSAVLALWEEGHPVD